MEQEIYDVLTDEQKRQIQQNIIDRKHRELLETRKNNAAYIESGKTGAFYSVIFFVVFLFIAIVAAIFGFDGISTFFLAATGLAGFILLGSLMIWSDVRY